MIKPFASQIVIIDDKILEEAWPLIQALSIKGYPVLHFTGKRSELPAKPLTGVRLLFVDMRLGLAGTSTIANVTAVAAIINKIISIDNGPYILIGWTKHESEIPDLLKILNPAPVDSISLDKSGCIVKGKCEFPLVVKQIDQKLINHGPIDLILFWQSLVSHASVSAVNDIFISGNGTTSLQSLLYEIARANLGERIDGSNDLQRTKAVLQVLNSILVDSLDLHIGNSDISQFKISNNIGSTDIVDKGKLNSKLLLIRPTDKTPYPGNVYAETDSHRKSLIKKFIQQRIPFEKIKREVKEEVHKANAKLFSTRGTELERNVLVDSAAGLYFSTLLAESKMVQVEVSPVCDYAQGNCKYHRVLSGFLLNKKYSGLLATSRGDSDFISDPLYIEALGDTYFLLIDYRGLATIKWGTLQYKKPIFRLRELFLFDLQYKAGTHFSRPGIVSLRE